MELPKQIVRIGEQTLWSSYRWADGQALANTSVEIFKLAIGGQGQGFAAALTVAETNLREGGRIPGGYSYNVEAIALHPYALGGNTATNVNPLVGNDMRNIHANLVLAWRFLQTEIDIAPAVLIGAGGGAFGDTADTGAADGGGGSRTMINNGNGQLWLYRRHPVMLPANATFAINYKWGGGAVVVDGGGDNYALILRTSLLGVFETAIAVA